MTVYFINEGLGTSNSGIEHAEFDRARLFRRNQVDFKIVTSNYIPNLHSILPLFAISDNESMNMFDYLRLITKSHRLFFSLPATVALVAIGFFSPNP